MTLTDENVDRAGCIGLGLLRVALHRAWGLASSRRDSTSSCAPGRGGRVWSARSGSGQDHRRHRAAGLRPRPRAFIEARPRGTFEGAGRVLALPWEQIREIRGL